MQITTPLKRSRLSLWEAPKGLRSHIVGQGWLTCFACRQAGSKNLRIHFLAFAKAQPARHNTVDDPDHIRDPYHVTDQ